MSIIDSVNQAVASALGVPDALLQKALDAAADMGNDRCASYSLFDRYYAGEQDTKLRDRARKYLDAHGLGFSENFCDTAVDTVAERLEILGFQSSAAEATVVDGKEQVEDAYATLLEEWWQRLNIDLTSQGAHTQTVMKGDGFLIVDYNPETGLPGFVFNEPHLVKPAYDPDRPGVMLYAAKSWSTDTAGPQNPSGRNIQRLNLYFPDRIEKWYRLQAGGEGGWSTWQDDTDVAWPLDWTDATGEPLGIPVFHLKHRSNGKPYGRSLLRSIVSFQDELNKTVIDLDELIDNHAWPLDYASGISGDIDAVDRVVGNFLKLSAPDAKMGRLEASPTSHLLEAIEGTLSRLARRSRLPMHLLTGGTPPSGESLKTAESGLVSLVEGAQLEFGVVWQQAALLALRLAAVNGAIPALPDDLTLTVQWKNPGTRSDKDDLETALLKRQLGVSKATLLAELGYDPDREAERRMSEAEEAAAALDTAMNSDPTARDRTRDEG